MGVFFSKFVSVEVINVGFEYFCWYFLRFKSFGDLLWI